MAPVSVALWWPCRDANRAQTAAGSWLMAGTCSAAAAAVVADVAVVVVDPGEQVTGVQGVSGRENVELG